MALHILAYPQNALNADETSQQAVSLQPHERLSKQASFSLKESSVDISLYLADEETPVWCVLSRELEVRA